MSELNTTKSSWLRPFFFYGNNILSLVGGALTTASAMVLIGFWVIDIFGRGGSSNPYIGIIVDLCLPALFVCGLILIPIGIWVRRRNLKAAGKIPTVFPQVNFGDPIFRRGIDIVVIVTFINFVIVGTASYRGVAYMDTPNFCGQACHVMAPEFAAYHVSSHRGVACTECHIAAGIPGFVHAKVNGTKQLMQVVMHSFPRPILADNKLPPAAATCLKCHDANGFIGDKILFKTTFGDDEKNSVTHSIVTLHVGGRDQFNQFSGIHGAHMGRITYVATDTSNQTILSVSKSIQNGSTVEYLATDAKSPVIGVARSMDCIDCHNRASHSFDTPEAALNKDMSRGTPSAALPFIHKEALTLLKATYSSQAEANSGIVKGIDQYYQSNYPSVWSGQRTLVDQAATDVAKIYSENVFPFMKVKWGTHPNNIGHNDYPGCFRCHDGSHTSKSGSTITNDCAVCHNLVAVDEANPKQLADLGLR